MRLNRYAGLAAMGGVLLAGCAKGYVRAFRPELPDAMGYVTAVRPQVPGSDGYVKAFRPELPDAMGYVTAVRPQVPALADFTPGPNRINTGQPRRDVTGPDVVTLLDGTPLAGKVVRVTPMVVAFEDGLVAPRVQVAAIEFDAPQAAPPLGTLDYNDAVALSDGTVVEAALVELHADALLVVYGPDGGHAQYRSAADVRAVTFRNRRDSACERAALLVASQDRPLAPSAEVSANSLDGVFIAWLETADSRNPDRLMRCIDRGEGRASACTISARSPQLQDCPFTFEDSSVIVFEDQVGDLSESTRFYYALRDGERTLGTSGMLQRGTRYDLLAPVRLAGHHRGEESFWDRSWRDAQDEGIHAVK